MTQRGVSPPLFKKPSPSPFKERGTQRVRLINDYKFAYARNRPRIKVALVLPKPKELEMATFTSALLATLGT